MNDDLISHSFFYDQALSMMVWESERALFMGRTAIVGGPMELEVFIVKAEKWVVWFEKIIFDGVFLKTSSKLYLIDKKFIGFVKFIFEAYDGIAVVETIDRHQSLIKLHVAPGCEADAEDVLLELKKEIFIEPAAEIKPSPDSIN